MIIQNIIDYFPISTEKADFGGSSVGITKEMFSMINDIFEFKLFKNSKQPK